MKKILFICLISIAFLTRVNALTARLHTGERLSDIRTEAVKGYTKRISIMYVLENEENDFVYCTNPLEKLNPNGDYTIYKQNDPIFNLSDKVLDKINLISYYGYKYSNHTDIKWYVVTQFLIWKQLDLDGVYFNDLKTGERIDKYIDELSELEALVNNYYTLPSFYNDTFYYDKNSSYEIVDENNILENYEIMESNIDSKIDGNKLIINTKEDGNYNIKLLRHSPISRDYTLYYLEGAQSLLKPGKVNDITLNINVKVVSGNLTIKKVDSENITRDNVSLKGAKYGIYSGDDLIKEVETNEYGIAIIKDLPLGIYTVKELEPSIGYELDLNTYEFEITKDNLNIEITSKEKVIKGTVVLTKYFGYKDNYDLEDGAKFAVYDWNNNLVGTYETEDGMVKFELPYGNYKVIQINGNELYGFVEDLNISITQKKEYTYDLYDELMMFAPIYDVPDTSKSGYNYLTPTISIIFGLVISIFNKIIKIKI